MRERAAAGPRLPGTCRVPGRPWQVPGCREHPYGGFGEATRTSACIPTAGNPGSPIWPGSAIAVNIERLSQLPPGENPAPRPPTAFQDYLDQHDIKRLRSWRAVS